MVLKALKDNVAHYVLIFLGAFGIVLLSDANIILDAHGLDGLKDAGIAALIAAAKAGFDALRVAISGPASSKP